MLPNSNYPTRMCISCRTRFMQKSLLRLQCVDLELKRFSGNGRSFYLCDDCINDEKKVLKSLLRQCKSSQKEKYLNRLKEIVIDE